MNTKVPKFDPRRALPDCEYELEDLGVERWETYRYPERGDYDAVYSGTGDTPAMALRSALDNACLDGWRVDHIAAAEAWSETDYACVCSDGIDYDRFYHAALRLRVVTD